MRKVKLDDVLAPLGVVRGEHKPIQVGLGDIQDITVMEQFYVYNNTSTDGCLIKAIRNEEVIYLLCTYDAFHYYDFFIVSEADYKWYEKRKKY